MKRNCRTVKEQREHRLEWIFLIGVFLFYFLWSCTQRFNFSSDESMRYQVAQYIYEYGSLPKGDEPLIRNEDWGISYAFNPIFSYILSAFVMKIVGIFSTSEWALLLGARFVNVLFGTGTAYIVRRASKRLFSGLSGWVFTCLVVFLPGNVILYSYVNCDALAMFSSAMIFYIWIRAAKEGWTLHNCVWLAAGMGLCLMSYYNAYGYVLISFFYFVATILLGEREKGSMSDRMKRLIGRGLLITGIVCAIALWWFVRNYILYDGDFLARKASHACAELYAKTKYKPSYSKTFQERGETMLSMIFYRPIFLEYSWIVNVIFSFVGAFGYNKIFLSRMIILPYLAFVLVSILLMIIYRRDDFYLKKDYLQVKKHLDGKVMQFRVTAPSGGWKEKGMLSLSMVIAILIPNYLNAYYSYSSDFQAQGRYSMPMLFPLIYFVTIGQKRFFEEHEKLQKYEKIFQILVILGAVGMAVWTWIRIIYPMYLQNYYGLH